jgi:hypothetical protein
MQIANPNLIVKAKTLEERMNRNPKSPLEEILEYNDLTRLGDWESFLSPTLSSLRVPYHGAPLGRRDR